MIKVSFQNNKKPILVKTDNGLIRTITDTQYNILNNTTGVNTGDETTATLKTKLGITILSGANTGDETSTSIVTKIGNGTKISSTYLPSYVDDVIEVDTFNNLPLTGETGIIYITIDTGYEYRWTGTVYIHINVTDISGKVDKETGKGLSTNDYDNTEKDSLSFVKNNAVNYTSSIPFTKALTDIDTHTMVGNITLTINTTGACDNACTQLLLVNNSSYLADVTAFHTIGEQDNTKAYTLLTFERKRGLYLVSIANFD
jgi:hypothetical protein